MLEHEEIKDVLRKHQIIPVVGLPSADAALRLAEILVACKLEIVEITFRTRWAVKGLQAIKTSFPDVTVIAGTVLTIEHVDQAIDAGAAAIVSPGFTKELADYCGERNIPFVPGICTPSEVQLAAASLRPGT